MNVEHWLKRAILLFPIVLLHHNLVFTAQKELEILEFGVKTQIDDYEASRLVTSEGKPNRRLWCVGGKKKKKRKEARLQPQLSN